MGHSRDRIAGALVGLAVGEAQAAGSHGWAEATETALAVAAVTATGTDDGEAVAGALRHTDLVGSADGTAMASLVGIVPMALARLGDDEALLDSGPAMAARTGGDLVAGQACGLWAVGLDRAIREGRLDGVVDALELLDPEQATAWTARLDAAATRPPGDVTATTPVGALQVALAAVWQTPVPEGEPCAHLQQALQAAVSGGSGGIVGALAGSLLGARWGLTAVPFAWQRPLRPARDGSDTRTADLVRLAVLTANRGANEDSGWPGTPQLAEHSAATHDNAPVLVALPDDPGVVAGNLAAIRQADVDAVISLCQVGYREVPDAVEHHHVFLVDALDANLNCDFVLDQAVEAVRTLRGEGKRIFVHCVGAASRTPTVVAGYLVREFGLTPEEAIDRVREVLFYPEHNTDFRAWLLSQAPDGVAPR